MRGQIQTVLGLLLEAETGLRGYRLTEREEFLEPYSDAFAELPRALASLVRHDGWRCCGYRLPSPDLVWRCMRSAR